jgi:hypothetical protein
MSTANPDNAYLDCDDMAAAYASKPLPKSPFFAAPPEDSSELLVGEISFSSLKEPAPSELPVLLEKHASRLAEMGHYDIAADVQLASERLPVLLQERDDYRAAMRSVADEAGAKICALEAELKRLSSSDSEASR